MEQRLNDEIESNVGAADYAHFLIMENKELSSHTALYNKPVHEAEQKLSAAKEKTDKCNAELKKLSDYIDLLKRKRQLYSTNKDAF